MASETSEAEMKPVDNHVDLPKEAEEEDDEATPKKKAKRRRSSSEVAAEGTPEERPSRERKTVERYSAVSPKRASATKSLLIKQGSGTKLQDIPNVVFKLSKRKVDDNLQALHALLFGRKSNVHTLKRNIFQFSGFVWPENEEKLRAKLKEKLDKYNKDKLTYFCELLDIHSLKASAKKEELTSKLLEFLESPHITRDVLLSEKDKKGKKRVRKTKGGTPTHRETKKKMKSSEPEVKKRKREPSKVEEQQEDDDEDGSTGTKDASSDEEDSGNSEEEKEQVNSEDANDETEKPVTSKKGRTEKAERIDEPKIEENTSPVKEGSPANSSKSPIRPASKKASVPAEDEPDMDVDSKRVSTKEQTKKASKATSREKGAKVKKEDKKKSQRKGSSEDVSDKGKKKAKSKEKPVHKDKKARKKKEDKSRSRVPNKEQGKGKTNARPSTEELRSVISSILKEVDFNTATLADILKQLGAHFKIDLMDRKTEVKQIIEEVINSMTDDEDVDEDEDCEGDDKEGDQEEEASDEDGKE